MLELFTLPPLDLWAIVDIAVVAFIIYQSLLLIRGTRAVQMSLGLTLVIAVFYISRGRLATLSWLLQNALSYLFIAVIVIFQSEIRRALAHFGKTSFLSGFSSVNRMEFYEEIVLAATTLAGRRTGALIVIERDIGLKNYIESGIALDSLVSYDILITVFDPAVPLHDGAVIIRNGRVAAAACFLPLTVNPRLSKGLGTRHRAAIGVTEETDAVAIVVSEETGSISVATDGNIERFLDAEGLRRRLRDVFERKSPRRAPSPVSSTVES
jgi:uncharacterized protein (TIGR00159 family)